MRLCEVKRLMGGGGCGGSRERELDGGGASR